MQPHNSIVESHGTQARGHSAAREDSEQRASLLHTVCDLVFVCPPLSLQAITVPALGKAWQKWAKEHRAKERPLQQAERVRCKTQPGWMAFDNIHVPLGAALQHPALSVEQQRRFVVKAVAHGDNGAADAFGVGRSSRSSQVGASSAFHKSLCAAAARGGQLEALQWLRARVCDWDAETCSLAAGGGHLAVLQWARCNGCDWDAETCSMAALGGHLAVLQWARANGCAWDAKTCMWAASRGHLAVLQWARANGWNAVTCSAAAGSGRLAELQWARANGCAWDADTCTWAARGCHLVVLQWARANGCPWDARTSQQATLFGHQEVFEWARANGCPEYE